MHACGHDGHIAIGLSVAKWIMDNKSKLNGKYMIIFQAAEEGVRGAKSIVGAGVLKDADYLLSGHISGPTAMGVEKGKVLVGAAGFLATTKIDIYFEGVSSHAGISPELGKNALLAAASCALNLHTLPQFGAGMSRINVGTLNAGTGRNVIASKAKLQIETRGENEKINELLKEKVDNVIKGSALLYDVKYRAELVGSAPSFDNYDAKFIEMIQNNLVTNGFATTSVGGLGGSEDVAFMMNEVQNHGGKAVYFIFGSNLKAAHHNNKFDFDEDVLDMARNVYVKTIELLNK
jgi:aminobenzoyl-glutamate utilization protein A